MDDRAFDALARSLAGGISRRRLIQGLLGGAALVGIKITPTVAASNVDICHRTGDGTFHVLRVNEQAIAAHLAHGDFRYTNCCTGAECSSGNCVDGTCGPRLPDLCRDGVCFYECFFGPGACPECNGNWNCLTDITGESFCMVPDTTIPCSDSSACSPGWICVGDRCIRPCGIA